MEEELLEVVRFLKQRHENIVKQLKMVAEADKDQTFVVQGKDGDQVEVKEKDRFGMQLGVKLALDVIGEFPVNIEENNSNEEE